MPQKSRAVACRCGRVELSASGAIIATSACFCDSCRGAGRALERLPRAMPILRADGGTEYVVVRKDRVQCLRGCDLLAERRETPGSATRRIVATCCNTFMFLDFTKGHWLNLNRDRLAPLERPPVDMHVMVRDLPAAIEPPAGVTQAKGLPPRLMLKLLGTWAAMGFGRHPIRYVQRTLDA